MSYELYKGSPSVYSLHYHLIIVVKYRRKVLDDIISEDLKRIILQISQDYDVSIIEQETDLDHIHVLFSAKPTLQIPKFISILKSLTSRLLRKEYPKLRKKLWGKSFWSSSYFIATTGQVTLEVIKKYVENQGKS